MPVGDLPAQNAVERVSRRDPSLSRKYTVLGTILVIVCILSLPIGVTAKTIYGYPDVLSAIAMFFRLVSDFLFRGVSYTSLQIMDMCPAYYEVWGRIGVLFISILCGGMLALSGSLYQMVFRNPIAAPTMLGVGNGITVGVIILVLVYGAAAPYAVGVHYLLCYLGAIAILGAVIGLAALIGKGKPPIVDMLLVGTLFSALLGQIIVFFSYCVFTDDQWEIFNSINEVLSINTELISYLILGIAFIVSVIPIILLRFKLNIVAFDPEEMHLAGIDPTKLRAIALVGGTIMIIAAQVHIGTVAMVALIVPFLSRLIFGAEFTKQTWGDLFIGAILIVICNSAVALINFALFYNNILITLPLGLVTNIVALPLFAWIMGTQKRGWE